MDYSIRFATGLKKYFANISKNIWQDFELNLLTDRTWGEDEILRASILKSGFDGGKKILNDINANNPVYNIKVETKDYGGKPDETITGADLAIVFETQINKKPLSRRLMLVQLKRAYFKKGVKKGGTSFEELHHLSGKEIYGVEFHQAQRMLFFTNHSVYWLAMTSGILSDKDSYGLYYKTSTLKESLKSNEAPLSLRTGVTDFNIELPILPNRIMLNALAALPASQMEELIYYYRDRPYRDVFHYLARPHLKEIQKEIDYLRENLPYYYYQSLKSNIEYLSKQQVGMIDKLAALVCHAETVFGLSFSKDRSFHAVYPTSIPFTEFMLRSIIGDEFGDQDEELINAVLKNDVSGYFRDRLEMFTKLYGGEISPNIEDFPAVKYSAALTLAIDTATERAQG
ncbi:MAG TPA: hypothetical protein VJ875_09775 [Pyrinomonadaceae bacterium]|nr:hypothetical protein [Pyrinomonadaceae bacterium]